MPCLNKWYVCILMLFFPLTAACQLWYEDSVVCLLWTDTQTEAHIERWELPDGYVYTAKEVLYHGWKVAKLFLMIKWLRETSVLKAPFVSPTDKSSLMISIPSLLNRLSLPFESFKRFVECSCSDVIS